MNIKNFAKVLYHWKKSKQISYSQTGEDVIAAFYLPQTKKGFYVDVGANDPVYLNNTYLFYKKGWRGICVEPSPAKARLLRLRRPGDRILVMGAGEKEGNLPFYVFDPDTLSTFSIKEAESYKKLGYHFLREDKVAVKILAQILTDYAADREIDLLSVDTEGQDLQVLKGNNWQRFRPKLVLAEVAEHCGNYGVRQHREFDDFMRACGYTKLADTYINALYLENNFAAAKKISPINA